MISCGNYQLRGFEPGNMGDTERVNLMFYHPEVMRGKGYIAGTKTNLHDVSRVMIGTPSSLTRRNSDISLAVTDFKSNVVGWIWFYRDKAHPLPKGVMKDLALNDDNSRIYQLSYEKLMSTGWPTKLLSHTKYVTTEHLNTERKGVIVAGLRLALDKITHEFRVLYATRKRLVIYAFVSLDNVASEKVLIKNEFSLVSRKYKTSGVLQNLWVKVI